MAKKSYIGISNYARNIKAMYVGVSNSAKKVLKGYIGDANGIARQFFLGYTLHTGSPFPTTWTSSDVKTASGTNTDGVVFDVVAETSDSDYTTYVKNLFTSTGYRVFDNLSSNNTILNRDITITCSKPINIASVYMYLDLAISGYTIWLYLYGSNVAGSVGTRLVSLSTSGSTAVESTTDIGDAFYQYWTVRVSCTTSGNTKLTHPKIKVIPQTYYTK